MGAAALVALLALASVGRCVLRIRAPDLLASSAPPFEPRPRPPEPHPPPHPAPRSASARSLRETAAASDPAASASAGPARAQPLIVGGSVASVRRYGYAAA